MSGATDEDAKQKLNRSIEDVQSQGRRDQIKFAALSTISNSLKAVFLGTCYGVYHGVSTAPSNTKVFSKTTFLTHFKGPILRFSGLFGAVSLAFEATRHTLLQLHYPHYTSLASTAGGAVAGGLFGNYAFDPAMRSTGLALRSSLLFAVCATAVDIMVLRHNHENYLRDQPDLQVKPKKLTDDEAQLLIDLYMERVKREKALEKQLEEQQQQQHGDKRESDTIKQS